MFPIMINDGNTPTPDSDVYYVVGKEGVFIKKRLGIMESLSPVKNISILESVQATAKMHIAKMPAIMVAKIANFFTDVYEEHRSEAVVLLFYNEEHEHYKIVVPPQKVSAAGAEYNRAITVEGYTMIGTIHSHANFSAFHSGTDQGDEQSFDGLHITFGHNQKDPISISASIVANGHRTIVEPEEYLEGVQKVVDIDEVEKVPTTRTYKWDPKQKKMVETTSKFQSQTFRTYRVFDKRYEITRRGNQKAATPKTWMDSVEKRTYTYTKYHGAGMGWWQGYQQGGYWKDGKYHPPGKENNKWGGNFDSSIWNKTNQRSPGALAKGIQDEKKQPPQNVGVKVDPIKFPTHTGNREDGPLVTDITAPEKPLPCFTCAFQQRAFEFIAEQIEKKYESLLEDEEENYYCDKCNILVSFEYDDEDEIKGEMVCPSCKSDEYLVQLVEDEEEDDPPVYQAIDDYGDDTIAKKNIIKCLSCKTEVDISMLVQSPAGGECPTCSTVLYPKQDLNYERVGEKLKCTACTSEFTYDLVKDDECPFCKAPLVENLDSGNSLLGDDTEEINEAAMKEIEDKNPARMIPAEKRGVFDFMKDKFLRRQ